MSLSFAVVVCPERGASMGAWPLAPLADSLHFAARPSTHGPAPYMVVVCPWCPNRLPITVQNNADTAARMNRAGIIASASFTSSTTNSRKGIFTPTTCTAIGWAELSSIFALPVEDSNHDHRNANGCVEHHTDHFTLFGTAGYPGCGFWRLLQRMLATTSKRGSGESKPSLLTFESTSADRYYRVPS